MPEGFERATPGAAQQVLIAGIPVDDAKNRAYLARMGGGNLPWPVPYKDSVQMVCAECAGKVWVGPELRKTRERMLAEGGTPLVLCLLCAALGMRGQVHTIVTLTDKKAGE